MKPLFAPELIVGLGLLEGRPVGVVANNPMALGGALFVDSADKAARFIWWCDAFNVPLVFLADVPGFMIGTEVERQGIIRHGAKMVTAVSEATVPKVSVIVRKAYGAGLYAMSGPGVRARGHHRAPTAKIAVMGPEAAVNAVFANKIAAIDDPDERAAFVDEQRRLYEEDVDLYRLASELVIDAVVDFPDLRAEVHPPPGHGGQTRTATSATAATESRRCDRRRPVAAAAGLRWSSARSVPATGCSRRPRCRWRPGRADRGADGAGRAASRRRRSSRRRRCRRWRERPRSSRRCPDRRRFRYVALVPNVRGAELAAECGVDELTLTVSASEAYSQRNVHMSIDESLAQVGAIRAAVGEPCPSTRCSAAPSGRPTRATSPAEVAALGPGPGGRLRRRDLRRHHRDGDAPPRPRPRRGSAPTSGSTCTTPGARRWSTHAALQVGVTRFDTSVGGLGGSPFAEGAGGNLATEELVALLDDLGVRTGFDVEALLAVSAQVAGWSATPYRRESPPPAPAGTRRCPGARPVAASSTPTPSSPTAPAPRVRQVAEPCRSAGRRRRHGRPGISSSWCWRRSSTWDGAWSRLIEWVVGRF